MTTMGVNIDLESRHPNQNLRFSRVDVVIRIQERVRETVFVSSQLSDCLLCVLSPVSDPIWGRIKRLPKSLSCRTSFLHHHIPKRKDEEALMDERQLLIVTYKVRQIWIYQASQSDCLLAGLWLRGSNPQKIKYQEFSFLFSFWSTWWHGHPEAGVLGGNWRQQ